MTETRDEARAPRPGSLERDGDDLEPAGRAGSGERDEDEPLGGDPPCWAHLLDELGDAPAPESEAARSERRAAS